MNQNPLAPPALFARAARVARTARPLLAAFFTLGLIVAWSPATAAAETVKARRTANVYVKPGERSDVVTTVRAGKKMSVLSRKGRWIKVKANGRTGWIVRTNVETKQARTTTTRTTRRKAFVKGRSRKRDLRRKSAPKDRLGIDATEDLDGDEDFDDEDGVDDEDIEEVKPRKRAAKRPSKDEDDDEGDDDDDDEGDDDDDDEGDDDDDDEEDDEEAAAEPARETAVAALDVEIRSRRSSKSDEVFAAEAGDTLFVLSRKGDWVEVENDDGDTGWIKESQLRMAGGAYQRKKLVYTASAGLGIVVLSQNFASNDTAATFGNYKIGSRAASLGIGGKAIYDYSPSVLLGGDLDFAYAISTPGIRVTEGMNNADTGFSTLDASLVGKGGYKLHAKTATAVYGRLGFRYSAFVVKNVQDTEGSNLAALPSEALKGPVVGFEVDAAKVTDTISANLKVDTMMLLGSRSQTGGLEDGADSSAKALFATLGIIYAYQPNLRILGGYQYGWASTRWSGRAMESARKHTATEAKRSDSSHVISVGAVRDF